MVADIQLLQGKLVEDPDKRAKNISRFIEELALEILSDGKGIAALESPEVITQNESAP